MAAWESESGCALMVLCVVVWFTLVNASSSNIICVLLHVAALVSSTCFDHTRSEHHLLWDSADSNSSGHSWKIFQYMLLWDHLIVQELLCEGIMKQMWVSWSLLASSACKGENYLHGKKERFYLEDVVWMILSQSYVGSLCLLVAVCEACVVSIYGLSLQITGSQDMRIC